MNKIWKIIKILIFFLEMNKIDKIWKIIKI